MGYHFPGGYPEPAIGGIMQHYLARQGPHRGRKLPLSR
ncbi:MAG: hypothetical protein ACJARR_002044 [Pseudophaeobacter arcticus]|jgi:hypothetical protein